MPRRKKRPGGLSTPSRRVIKPVLAISSFPPWTGDTTARTGTRSMRVRLLLQPFSLLVAKS